MTTFALIHGGLHGGWCWELVVPELEALGHRAFAPELPVDDPGAGAMTWATTVAEAIGDAEDVVAVGHSMGGMALPPLASICPLRRMVFLAAMVPVPGAVYGSYLAGQPDAILVDWSAADDPGSQLPPYEVIRNHLYQDCDEVVAQNAYRRLRPQALTVFTERHPVERWPSTPSTSIVMADDRCVGPEWSRRVAAERLQTTPIELPGGHSPFYSRPQELAEVLATL